MSRTLVFVVVGALMLPSAFAQAPSAPTTPSATPPANVSTPAQSSDEWLASQLKGTAVIGSDDQRIGEISDVLFDKMDHVKAYVVSIGGFLGIGAKEVALEPSAFQETPIIEGRPQEKQFTVPRMKLSMTTDQLKKMPEFKPLSNPSPTTGAASNSTSRSVGTGRPRPAESK
jgi:PRC-barrel domain protein